MLMRYLDYVVEYITDSESFRKLLKQYKLSRKDGDVIRFNLFDYDLVIPYDKNRNIVYEIWAIEEFKNLFINYYKKKYPFKEMNLDYLNSYCRISDNFLKEKEEVIKVNEIFEDYMGKDKLSKQYLNDLSDYNLLSRYLEITIKFLSTPLNKYRKISNVRGYVLNYLKEISKKNQLDNESPQSIEEVIDFIILNSSKDFIDSMYVHEEFKWKFNYWDDENDELWNMIQFISKYFNFYNNPSLVIDCLNSKYNDLKYSYIIYDYDEKDEPVSNDEEDTKSEPISLDYDDLSNYKFGALTSSTFDALIIINELREKIQKDYENIIKTNFKNRLIETKNGYYIHDEIDKYSLNFLEELFLKEKYDNLINYYGLSEKEGLEIKDACYVFCFECQNHEFKVLRDFWIGRKFLIVREFYSNFRNHYDILLDNNKKSLKKFFDYSNYKKLHGLMKDYLIQEDIKYHLKDDELREFLYNELYERNLLDYYECIDLSKKADSLISEKNIKELLDEFEDSYDFSTPQNLMESIEYIIENTSREFIDKVYNSERDYISNLHWSLGMYIRNEFGINNQSNKRLLENIKESKYSWYGTNEPDFVSSAILDEFYDYVQENYDEIIKNTKFKNKIDMYKYLLTDEDFN